MNAILLLGGLGTRLAPYTLARPKPLLPLLDRPMIAWQLAQLKRCGVRQVVLALGHKAAHFRRTLGDGRRWGVRFIYSIEREPLGTGGAIGLAARRLKGPALVLNGDILSDLDLGALVRSHRRRRAEATLALVPVPDASAFGLVDTGPGGRIRSFKEKPPAGAGGGNINAGFYLFEPAVFQAIPAGRPVSVEREVFPALLREGRRLFGHIHRGYWSDVGTLAAYHAAHADMLRDYAAWNARLPLGARRRQGALAAPGARVHPSASIKGRVWLGPRCRVEGGAALGGFVCAGAGVVIGRGAAVSDSVLHSRARVGTGAVVEGVILGEGARVEAGGRVGPGVAVPPRGVSGAFSASFSPRALISRAKTAKIPR